VSITDGQTAQTSWEAVEAADVKMIARRVEIETEFKLRRASYLVC
jgi:hypothetical protein